MNSTEEISKSISEHIKDRSFENVAKGGDVGGFILNDMEGVILEALQALQSQGFFIGRWETITDNIVGKSGCYLVTNNPYNRLNNGEMSHVWKTTLIQKDGGEYIAFTEGHNKIHGVTMYQHIYPPKGGDDV